jgi:hypothetical protein
VLIAAGKRDEAERLLRDVYATQSAVFGARHADTRETLASLVTMLVRRHKYADAEHFQRLALSALREALGAEHPATTRAAQELRDIEERASSSSTASTSHAAGHLGHLGPLVGAHFEVRGLVTRAELNGQEGTVLAANMGSAADRFLVRLGGLGASQVLLKRENFFVLCSSPSCTKRDEASFKCTRCMWARYCCKACQAAHWKTHKAECK